MTPNQFYREHQPRGLFALLIACVLSCGPVFASSGIDNQKIDIGLQNYLNDQNVDWVRILVMMKDVVDTRQLEQQSRFRQVRHEIIVSALKEKAEETQTGLLQYLESARQLDQARRYRSFWITNLVAVEVSRGIVADIANRPEVETVYLDYPIELIRPVSSGPPETAPGMAEPGLREINANKLWDIGITGSNVIVMNLDTGVDGAHPALVDRWRGLEPGVDPHWAWFNPDDPNQTFPVDFDIHGTHTMGTLTGLAPATDDTIGVAIGSKWIAAAWDFTTLNKFISDAIAGFNWGADPDGNPNTVDDVPAVISNSWGVGVQFGQPPCDASFWEAIDNAEAAGVAIFFSAGGNGPGAMSITAPADRNTTLTNCFSVGALNAGSMTIASFSSRGPTACPGTGEEKIKPEVCARGVSVRSSVPGGGYLIFSGTSMACPHVAGAVALLRDAFPNATVDDLKNALMETAVDLGTTGEDNTYGHGRIDVFAAYQSLLGSGGIPCTDITSMAARCIGGGTKTVQVRVNLLNNIIHAGEMVTITIDGTPFSATIVTNGTHSRANFSVDGWSVGDHTVSLIDPPGCLADVHATCAAGDGMAKADPYWNDDAVWNSRSVPQATRLLGNYPNPFNPSTSIQYDLGEDVHVTLKIYNTLGQEVATPVDEFQSAGFKSATWNGRNEAGASVTSGIYIYKLTAGNVVKSEKMMLMK